MSTKFTGTQLRSQHYSTSTYIRPPLVLRSCVPILQQQFLCSKKSLLGDTESNMHAHCELNRRLAAYRCGLVCHI